MTDTIDVAALVERLRHLVALNEPQNGGPYQGYAAQQFIEAAREAATALQSQADALAEARRENERLRTQGNWAVLHDVLNYLNTLEDRVVAKKDIYAAVMEMRPHPPVSQDENFQDYHDGVVSALVERATTAEASLATMREALETALAKVQYQPGDHPVVPTKHAQFVEDIRALGGTNAE